MEESESGNFCFCSESQGTHDNSVMNFALPSPMKK